MRIDTDDINRVRAAKTPGWRHGTKKRPNPEKRVKATKVRGQRRGKRVSKNKTLAKSYAEHMDKAKRGVL
ncbi:hypothetical protein GCM10027043_53070 [Ferruginibacter profundus]